METTQVLPRGRPKTYTTTEDLKHAQNRNARKAYHKKHGLSETKINEIHLKRQRERKITELKIILKTKFKESSLEELNLLFNNISPENIVI